MFETLNTINTNVNYNLSCIYDIIISILHIILLIFKHLFVCIKLSKKSIETQAIRLLPKPNPEYFLHSD